MNGTCPWTGERTGEGQHRDTNNNDNNILFNLFKNNNSDFVGFKEGDEVSNFLKSKGINTVEEFKSLEPSKQDDLIEEWFLKTR